MSSIARTSDVRLRALVSSDLERLRSFVNDPDVLHQSNTFRPISDTQQEQWWKHAMADAHASWFGIETVADQALIGTCCLVDHEPIARHAELRIRIGARDAWGKSFGRQACEQLVDFGFAQLNLNRIWLRVAAGHARARSVYTKLGFVVEGELRNAVYLAGKFENLVLMGLLRDEWSPGDRR